MKTLVKVLFVGFLFSYAINHAQIKTVSMGYGPFGFPPMTNEQGQVLAEATRGGAAYLNIGIEVNNDNVAGLQIIFGGDSQISYGGKDYGSGFGGLLLTHDMAWPSDKVRIGVAAGGIMIQNYQARENSLKDAGLPYDTTFGNRPLPEMKSTNFQPFGALRLSVYFVELQYAPVNGMITAGVNLAFGR